MTSTLILYFNTKIEIDKNMKIDELSSYLSTKQSITINDFQYIKHTKEISIKVDLSQTYLNYSEANNIDYISIQNGNEKKVYYLVINKEWKSTSTIKFELYMDTINSYNGDYTLSNRTKVVREHKDRWKKISSGQSQTFTGTFSVGEGEEGEEGIVERRITFELNQGYVIRYQTSYNADIEYENVIFPSYAVATLIVRWSTEVTNELEYSITFVYSETGKIQRIIDEYQEGINPMMYKQEETQIDEDGLSWNLVYKGSESLDVILYPSENIQCKIAEPFILTSGKYYINPFYNSKPCIIHLYSTTYNKYVSPKEYEINGVKYYEVYLIQYQDNYWQVAKAIYKEVIVDGVATYQLYKPFTISSSEEQRLTTITILYNGSNFNYSLTTFNFEIYNASHVTQFTIKDIQSINSIDRSEKELIRIIEFPYCPIHYDIQNGYYVFDDVVVFDTAQNNLKITKYVESSFYNQIETDIENPLKPLFPITSSAILGMDREDFYESKLFNSEFYNPKFVYDSFSYLFRLETQDEVENVNNFKFNFVASKTGNSKFLFDFIQEHFKLSREDYDSILFVARNNESLILNSDYLNYLRNGYNYDLKNKDINKQATLFGAISKEIGGVTSLASGVATGNVGAIISGVSSMGMAIPNAINSLAKQELAINEKLHTLQNQSLSISSSDDLDLLKYYTNGNKAKMVLYKPSERMLKLLGDLFYFTGYATQEFKIPNEHTRTYFNYIQAELVFDNSKNLSNEILEDIKERYKIGVTIYHKVNNDWDIEQTKENFERSLFE